LENDELPRGHQFASFEDLRRFVDFVSGSGAFRGNQFPRFFQVKCNGDRDYSEAEGPNTLWICKEHWYPSIVLHEMAHFMTSPKSESHGQEFLFNYIWLLEKFLGERYAAIYRGAFIREGLLVKP
jgi:putative metallohydrolase (TIGR04338 family)